MKKNFPLLAAFIFSIILISCDSLFSGVGEGGSSAITQTQDGKSGSVTLSGRISCYGADMPSLDGVPDSFDTPSDAKSAMPDMSYIPTVAQDRFFMYAVSGVTEVYGTITKDTSVTPQALNYSISLGTGTWTLIAGVKDDSGNIMLSGKKSFTISDVNPVVDAVNIAIAPLQTAGGTGDIDLEISVDSGAGVTEFTMECISGNASEWDAKVNGSINTSVCSLNATGIASGTYLVSMNFYKKDALMRKFLAFNTTQQINVYDMQVTRKWWSEGGSADDDLIAGGMMNITLQHVEAFQSKTLYVDGTSGKTLAEGGNGTWVNPFKAVCEAVLKINFYSLDDTMVFVAGTTSETNAINIKKKCTIKQWPGEAAGTIRRNGNDSNMISVTAAGTLVMENLTIDGAGVEVHSDGAGLRNEGTVTLSSVKIKDCKTEDQGLGGGIYNSGNMEMTGGEISGCVAGLGGGIFTGTGTMEIAGVLISGCTAEEGGGIYNENKLTVTDGKISGCTAKDGSAVYAKGISGSSEDNVNLTGGLEITGNTTWEGTIRAGTQAKIKADGIKIYGNDAYNRGGAIFIGDGSKFTMASGEIYSNNAKKLNWPGVARTGDGDGGAIFLWGASGNTGSFIMNGGSIYDNVAGGNGGCIYIQDGSGKASSFTMTAGSVYGNTAAIGNAVYHTEGGKINLSGSAYIAADNEIYLGSSNDFYVTVAGALTPPAEAAGTVAHIVKDGAATGKIVLGGTAALVQSEYEKFEYDGAFEIESSGKLASVIYVYGGAATSGDGSMTSPKKQLSDAYSSVKNGGEMALVYVAGTTSEGAVTNIASGDALTDITVKQWPQDKWERAGYSGVVPAAVIGNGTMVTSDPLITIATGKTALFKDISFDGNSIEHSNMYGGGINNSGDLTLDNVTVKSFVVKSTTDDVYGGGIYNAGTLTVKDAVISGCKVTSTGSGKISRGGGIYNKGTATIKKAIITGCEIQGTSTSRCNGGGIANYEDGAVLTLGDGVLDGGTPDVIIGIGTYNGVEYTTPNKGTKTNGVGVASGIFPGSGSTTITLNKDCVIGKYNPGSVATINSCGNYSKGSSAGLNCGTGTNFTINGAHITYNYVENYAGNIVGGITYFNSLCTASINDLDISYNRVNNSDESDLGLIMTTYGYKFENLNVHDNVWNAASTARGHGMYVYGNEKVEFAGSTCFDTDADVYLKDGAKIRIGSTLTAPEVAVITPEYYNVDSSGAAVAPIQLLTESSSGLIAGNYSKFKITDRISGDYVIPYGLNSEGKLVGVSVATLAEIVPNFDSSKIYKIIISEDTPNFETLCNALKDSSAKFELDLSNTNVTTLEKGAIHGLSKMTALELPSGLTTMKAGAIYSNSNLTSIEIPATVTTIEGNPFVYANYGSSTVICYDSSKLTSISIATGNSSYVVDDGILYSSDKTELVYYPSNKTASTFAIPGTVTTIGEAAFAGNTKLTQVNFNAGLTTIGDYAFAKLSNNKTVIIPASVTSIGECSFYANYKLETLTITGGNSYTIGNSAFSYFGIHTQGATKNCKVTIGEGVESLSQSAFMMSYFDTSEDDPLVLPASLKVLDRFNFDRGEVKFIKSLATTPPVVGNSSLYDTGIQKIFVPSGSVEAYKAAGRWKEYTIIGF